MRVYSKPMGIFTGVTVLLLAAQPVKAADVQITGVQMRQTESGFSLILQTGSSQAPQVFTVQDGNRLVAEVLNSQLQLANGNSFRQDNPSPGVSRVEITQINSETVRITVTGMNEAPVGQILQRDAGQVTFGFAATSQDIPRITVEREVDAAQVPTPPPAESNPPASSSSVPSSLDIPDISPQPDTENLVDGSGAATSLPTDANAALPPQNNPAPQNVPEFDAELFDQLAQRSEVLVPRPEITIEGNPAPPAQPAQPVSPAPPFLPRAVPPPVGDIAISNVDSSPQIIDLGTSARVPRIILQDAPVREVLGLLARTANLQLIFTDPQGEGEGEGGRTVSLDLEDAPIQDIFNAVIHATGLKVSRRGNNLLVGSNLPADAQNIVTRTFRLNQVEAESAATFLASLGAETQLLVQVEEDIVNPQTQEVIGRRQTPPELRTITAQIGEGGAASANYILTGLTVATDDRMNALTMIGDPTKIATATQFLTQLDARLRQVAVNVKIIDVNLQNIGRFGTSFSFGINDTTVLNEGGLGIVNFGTDPTTLSDGNDPFIFDSDAAPTDVDGNPVPPRQATPAATGLTADQVGSIASSPLIRNFETIDAFLLQLQATIQNNDAKIITDPTLIIQEGSEAGVNLTQEVVGDITVETTASAGATTTEVNVEKEEVGLQLGIAVERIDDNGFITMAINPTVSAIGNTQEINAQGISNDIVLINRRNLTTGTIRLRDGQTLILTGVIQDRDQVNVQKIPILGDLPLIGSLFRRTTRENERREVIVIVTPNIMDDSQRTNFGYTRPPANTEELLEQQRLLREGNR